MSGRFTVEEGIGCLKTERDESAVLGKKCRVFPKQESRNAAGAILYKTDSPRTRAEETAEEAKEDVVVRKWFD